MQAKSQKLLLRPKSSKNYDVKNVLEQIHTKAESIEKSMDQKPGQKFSEKIRYKVFGVQQQNIHRQNQKVANHFTNYQNLELFSSIKS